MKTAFAIALALSSLTCTVVRAAPPDDRLARSRAAEAVIWGMPVVNYDLMLQEMLTRTPGKVNQVICRQANDLVKPITAALLAE